MVATKAHSIEGAVVTDHLAGEAAVPIPRPFTDRDEPVPGECYTFSAPVGPVPRWVQRLVAKQEERLYVVEEAQDA